MLELSPFQDGINAVQSNIHNPHGLLGIHSLNEKSKVIRLWRPQATSIYLEVKGEILQSTLVHKDGIFELRVPSSIGPKDYKVYHHGGLLSFDPYAFSPTIGDLDAYLFSQGVHYKLYDILGARLHTENGVQGVRFSLWAPSARSVSLIGDFNHWDGRVNPMRSLGGCGLWEIFIPGLAVGEKYKFEIVTSEGTIKVKSDPMAYYSELRPNTASIVADVDTYQWNDTQWRLKKQHSNIETPVLIYEVHLSSWKRSEHGFINFRQLAHELAEYCRYMGFTHVELLPISEHPLDESWGYQITGPFAITSRHGNPSDFQYFVDYMHQNQIGVIVDWVAAHFPVDDFSLAQFDGTCLYEHQDPKQGFHPHWNTYIYNYGRKEVSNFLIANALFWFDKMHVDGLRVDAVASMLYLDYGREDGQWIPNKYGGKENLEAVEFLKHLNSIVHEQFPKALMIAEESTSYPGVTHSLESGGLGFDMKWNMGWMNDTLSYFKTDPFFRRYHHNQLTFGLLYAFSEKFALVLSHDEVVHGKASLLSKMPGDTWQKFANLRLIYSYMLCQPGKKLIFMGAELGQWTEWSCKEELPWYLLDFPYHKGIQNLVRDINHFYQNNSSLWSRDFDSRGFEWVEFSDRVNSVVSYLRKSDQEIVLCVHNFTPSYFSEYFIPLKNIESIEEVFNTDREEYEGSGKINTFVNLCYEGYSCVGFTMQLPPLATAIFKVNFL
ncbi:MAG: 1,4-alpha-glucan branching protein GlgB [Chlamydiae bacterium]|nr:1,4-alpha-glucan branching protein GlgB [Chlamydiota bacterium]